MKKVIDIKELPQKILNLRKEGKVVGLCHGCFDVFHIGHLRHLKEAKEMCDVLIVTITPDEFIEKGPGRPIFEQIYRAELMSNVDYVNFTSINKWSTAESTLKLLKPDLYFKGPDYSNTKDSRFLAEQSLCEELNIKLHITNDIVSSSTWIIERLNA